jgi:tRNA U34 5-methylaminomethyl-2-thiouridine-forming methyltransferase MnmC
MYITRGDRNGLNKKVVIEVYTGAGTVRDRLKTAGFTFTEEDFLNSFWGVRFLVELPTGKGAMARRKFLSEVCK